jgi:hypothetical protein
MKLKMRFMAIFVAMIMFAAPGAVFAEDGGNSSILPDAETQAGKIKYQEKALDKEFTFRGRAFIGSGYTDNADFEDLKASFEDNLLETACEAHALGHLFRTTKEETFRKSYAKDVENLLAGAIEDIYNPIAANWDEGVKGTSLDVEVGELAKEVESNGRYIDALWLEDHGLTSITVQVVIDKLSGDFQVLDAEGEKVKSVFIASSGTLSGLQKKEATKVVTLAYDAKYGSYGILLCPDVYAGVPLDTSNDWRDVREVEMFMTHKYLTEEGVKKILGSAAFQLTKDDIEELRLSE